MSFSIDIHHYIHLEPSDFVVQKLTSIEGKVIQMNADLQAFVTDVKTKFATIQTNLGNISADEKTLIDKITALQGSTTLGDDDKAALADVLAQAQSIADQTSTIDANVPNTPVVVPPTDGSTV